MKEKAIEKERRTETKHPANQDDQDLHCRRECEGGWPASFRCGLADSPLRQDMIVTASVSIGRITLPLHAGTEL